MEDQQKFVIAIAGCGLIGAQHAAELALLGNAPRYFYDRYVAASEALAAKHEGKAVESFEELAANPEIDAIYICTYNDSHLPYARLTCEHGKHLFIEKPLALTVKDSVAIAEAVKQAGVICMTGFKFRYTESFRKAKDLLPNPKLLTATIFEPRWPDGSWANDPVSGGGNVLSQGCHMIDLLIAMASSEPKRVHALARNFHHPSLDIIDAIAGTIEFENGAIATFTFGDMGAVALTSKFHLSALDGKSSVQLHNRMKTLDYFDGSSPKRFKEPTESGFHNENVEFLNALREERQPLTNVHDGLLTTTVLETAIAASREGRALDIVLPRAVNE